LNQKENARGQVNRLNKRSREDENLGRKAIHEYIKGKQSSHDMTRQDKTGKD
jgi:hypothetical protein